MRSFLAIAIAACCVAIGAGSLRAELPAGRWHHDLDAAWEQSQATGQPMLLFVTMDGCAFCIKMTRLTFANEQVQSDLETAYVAAAVDGVKHPAVAQQLRVRAYPATFLVAPDTRVLDRIDGFVAPAELRRRLERARLSLAETAARQAQLPRE